MNLYFSITTENDTFKFDHEVSSQLFHQAIQLYLFRINNSVIVSESRGKKKTTVGNYVGESYLPVCVTQRAFKLAFLILTMSCIILLNFMLLIAFVQIYSFWYCIF